MGGWDTASIAETAARIVLVLLAAAVGGSIASFLCLAYERVPRGESLSGRSHCVCGRQLTWWENVPVASWLALRGRARCCGARLPGRYLVWEAVGATVAGAAAAVAVLVL